MSDLFDQDPGQGRDRDDPALLVDVDGYEGPLDLLLELARRQKVDLTRISIRQRSGQRVVYAPSSRRS